MQAGNGIQVTEVANKQFVVSNTAPGMQGGAGSDGAVQTVYINDGAGVEKYYDASPVSGLRSTGALGALCNDTLTVSGLKGADGQDASTPQDGQDGAQAAMQNITVAGQTYTSNTLSEVVSTGTVAPLQDGVLTLESLAGGDGDNGLDSAMSSIVVADQTYNADTLSQVVFPGATATLENGSLTLEGLAGGDGEKGTPFSHGKHHGCRSDVNV